MTDGQYRALVAYLNFWPKLVPVFGFDEALHDLEITDNRDEVILQLARAGHDWDEDSKSLKYRF